MTVNVAIAKRMVEQSCLYVPHDDSEAMRIITHDDDCFYTEGEESGESYQIKYTEVDVALDLFYKLQIVEPESV